MLGCMSLLLLPIPPRLGEHYARHLLPLSIRFPTFRDTPIHVFFVLVLVNNLVRELVFVVCNWGGGWRTEEGIMCGDWRTEEGSMCGDWRMESGWTRLCVAS